MIDFLFIAEKPSLGREVAAALSASRGEKKVDGDGYCTVGNSVVTWVFGHMYELAPPEVYDPSFKTWRLEPLPIVPERWKRVFRPQGAAQLRRVNDFIKQATTIVNVGDAAREGQLLVDEIIIEAGVDPHSSSVKRMWVRSMTAKDMMAALSDLLPNSEKKGLFESAFSRQKADWLHGLNLSRCYTILARRSGADATVSIGRVMTPTMKLVVDRDRQIENFVPVDYFVPTMTFEHSKGTFHATWMSREGVGRLDAEGRLLDGAAARALVERIVGRPGVVREFKVSQEAIAPKLPYSLSALQIDCSAKYGMTAKKTLDICQSLYETHKVVSYPRSDSRHLPLSILTDEAPEILRRLRMVTKFQAAATGADMTLKSAAWNDAKVSDHHAIIPTIAVDAMKVARLSTEEAKVFELVAKAFLAQFYHPHRYERQTARLSICDEMFEARGRRLVNSGWKAVYDGADVDEDEVEDEDVLPAMSSGDPVQAKSFQVQSKRTQPPSRFTDGTLIDAMTNVHRFVSDPEIKKHLREKDGLGTEATRGAIIEKLVDVRFLIRKAKFIHSSTLGRSICDLVPHEIQDPGLTALWEGALDKIVEGSLSADDFMKAQEKVLRKRIQQALSSTVELKGVTPDPLPGHGEKCSVCSDGKMVTKTAKRGAHSGKRYLSCDRYPDCKNITSLEGYKEPDPLPGHGDDCPACGAGKLITRNAAKGPKQRRFLSCNRYPECTYAAAGDIEKVEPLSGHGDQCQVCKKGTMQTRIARKGPSKGQRFLSCSAYPDCKNAISPQAKRGFLSGKFKPLQVGAKEKA